MTQAEPTAELIDDLKIALAGGEVVRVGPAVSLHHNRSRDAGTTAQVAGLLEHFLAVAQSHIRFIKRDTADWQPIGQSEVRYIAQEINAAKHSRGFYLALHGGEHPQDAHPVAFQCMIPADWSPEPSTYVSAGFTMGLLVERQARLTSWAQTACEIFDPFHGSGGFTLALNPSWAYAADVVEQIAAILERFPGLDHPALPTGGFVTRSGPVCANWLTILGMSLVNKMGGQAAVVQAMQDVQGQTLSWLGGLVLVAPGAPQIGDRDADAFPSSYRKVGSLIAALRGAKEAVYFAGANDRDMRIFGKAWRARFD